MPIECFPMSCVFAKSCWIPQRWILVIIAFFGVIYTYMMRIAFNLSFAYLIPNSNITDEGFCDCHFRRPDEYKVQYEWSEILQGVILASFFIGYFFGQILIVVAEKCNRKWILSLFMFQQSLCFLSIPFVLKMSGWLLVVVARILQGFSASFVLPTASGLLSDWIPPRDRYVVDIIMFSASHFGTILGLFVTKYIIILSGNWVYPYYILGGLGLSWIPVFVALCYKGFAEHPFITDHELRYLERELTPLKNPSIKKIPLKYMLESKALWGLIFATISHDFSYYLMVTEISKYLYETMREGISANANLSALSFLCLWIGAIFFGLIRNCIKSSTVCSIVCIRRIFTTIGLVIPAVFMLATSFRDCTDWMENSIYLCLAMWFMGAYYSGVPMNILDIAPNLSEYVGVILNLFGVAQGIIAPIAVAYIAPTPSYFSWQCVFIANLSICVLSTITYLICASSRRQSWDIE